MRKFKKILSAITVIAQLATIFIIPAAAVDYSNVIVNGAFSGGVSGWSSFGGGSLSYEDMTGGLKAGCLKFVQTDMNSAPITTENVTFVKGLSYTLSFTFKMATAETKNVNVDFRSETGGLTFSNVSGTYGPFNNTYWYRYEMGQVSDTDWHTYTKTFTVTDSGNTAGTISTNVAFLFKVASGTNNTTSYIDDISISPAFDINDVISDSDNIMANGGFETDTSDWSVGEAVTLSRSISETDGSVGSMKVVTSSSYNNYPYGTMNNMLGGQWYKISANIKVDNYSGSGASARFYIETNGDAVSADEFSLHYKFSDTKYWYKDNYCYHLNSDWNHIVTYVRLGSAVSPRLMLMVRDYVNSQVDQQPANPYTYYLDSVRVEAVNSAGVKDNLFEEGGAGWYGFGAATSSDSSAVYSGNKSLLASGLTVSYAGVRQKIYPMADHTYTISAKIKMNTSDYTSVNYTGARPFVGIYNTYADTPYIYSQTTDSNGWMTRSLTFTWTQSNAETYTEPYIQIGIFSNEGLIPFNIDEVSMYDNANLGTDTDVIYNGDFKTDVSGWKAGIFGYSDEEESVVAHDSFNGAKVTQGYTSSVLFQHKELKKNQSYYISAEVKNANTAVDTIGRMVAGVCLEADSPAISVDSEKYGWSNVSGTRAYSDDWVTVGGEDWVTVGGVVKFDDANASAGDTFEAIVFADVRDRNGAALATYNVRNIRIIPIIESEFTKVSSVALNNSLEPSIAVLGQSAYIIKYRYLAEYNGVWEVIAAGYIPSDGDMPSLAVADYMGIPVKVEITPVSNDGIFGTTARSNTVAVIGSFTLSGIEIYDTEDTLTPLGSISSSAMSNGIFARILYTNTTGGGVQGKVVFACYNGNVLKSVALKDVALAASGSEIEVPNETEDTIAIPAGTTRVKVMLVENLETLRPLGSFAVIPE